MKKKIPWLAIGCILLTFTCLLFISIGACGYIRLSKRIRVLETSVLVSVPTDLQLTVDFLKDQMQFLIWQLGTVLVGFGAILTFFGLHTRKSIEEKYDLEFKKLLQVKDERVFEKQVLFLYKEKDEHFTKFRNEICDRMYNTKMVQTRTVKDIPELTNVSIVIYQVDKDDYEMDEEIAGRCELEHIHCILYCPKRNFKNELMTKDLAYMSTSKQIAKLRESLYILLYLAPLRE